MAKKRIEQSVDDEQESVEYSDVEPEVVEDTYTFDKPPSDGLAVVGNFDPQELITKPGGAAVTLDTPTDEPTYRVTLALPYGVLVALLEPEHADADTERAIALAVLTSHTYEPTPIGQLVLAGFDQTAVRHKMLAAWRENHNRGVGGVK